MTASQIAGATLVGLTAFVVLGYTVQHAGWRNGAIAWLGVLATTALVVGGAVFLAGLPA